MQSFAAILAASALIGSVTASPILQQRATCGSAPTGSTSQTPLSQPTGITTAEACQAQCEANSSCQSFVFGMVNNGDECILYSVAASNVPKQASTNLIAYDKACTSVPAVVPTASNPTGAATNANTNTNTNTNHKRDTCGAAPTGTSSQAPLSSPSATTAEACQAQCDANSACQSFVFGMVNNAVECILYSVSAASVPKQSSTNLIAYDKACTSVPAVVPTTSNPTGAATTTTSNTSGNTDTNTNTNTNHKRADTCAATPSATTAQTPISTPAGITTAEQCQIQCDASSSCLSFVFGMVNNADMCMLYAVAASAIPTQTSSNLVSYDKACASVPTQTPTADNPTGADSGTAATGSSGSTSTGSTGSTGSTSTTGTTSNKGSNSGAQGGKGN